MTIDRTPAAEQVAEVLRIVAEWVIEAYDGGGVDAGDLVWRLEQARYRLPEDAS